MDKEDSRSVIKFLWIKRSGAKTIDQKVMSTLGDDASWQVHMKMWVQGARKGDF
jgi:hypothetical protein